ncbi:hypothetical protein [Solimonas variicoloris]|uniref:hypothetical protein n=1 Tax=Solimonas variicoloris TaxID=254408 RepID=UPI0012B60F3F|nr:hypothetical protein [Solimonas variicoloris]
MHIVHFASTPFQVPPPTYGAAERIVVNGWMVHSYEEALEATRRALAMSPAERSLWARRCRERVTSVADMAVGYQVLYERVIAGEALSHSGEVCAAGEPPITEILKRRLPANLNSSSHL